MLYADPPAFRPLTSRPSQKLIMTPRAHTFDIIALGAGTAGSGVVRYASKYGKSAAIIERTSGYGGTCVQVRALARGPPEERRARH